MIIPETLSGRPVTVRGVHLLPFPYHANWCQDEGRRKYWLDLLKSMNMSWVVILDSGGSLKDGTSTLEKFGGKPVVAWLLERGIIPIVRYHAQLPDGFTGEQTVRDLVSVYKQYGAPVPFVLWNEPGDDREWKGGKVPADWFSVFVSRWKDGARKVIDCGGYPGFPDGPCYDQNPFAYLQDVKWMWEQGLAWYAGHHYGLGRPLQYPQDNVSRNGTPISYAEYQAELDDFAGNPDFDEGEQFVLNKMNPRRKAWADPDLTPIQDDTCFRGFEKVQHWAREAYGFEVQIAMTEGGWTPKARAGGGDDQDYRWPPYTPRKVAQVTLEMYRHRVLDPETGKMVCPLFALCPWIVATQDMGGAGWDTDAWVGYWYEELYGREKPVVRALQGEEPEPPPEAGLVEEIDAARASVARVRALVNQLP